MKMGEIKGATIERETEKAILAKVQLAFSEKFIKIWLPKSQVEVTESNNLHNIKLPEWLYMAKCRDYQADILAVEI